MSNTDNLDTADRVWRPMTQHKPLIGQAPRTVATASGCYLTDCDGNTFLDGLAGLWCVNVGYGRRELADVAHQQMIDLSYLAPVMVSESTTALASKIQDALGMKVHVSFSCSGSEANETAFKIARQYHQQSDDPNGARRYKILSRYRAYHGNTMGSMAATGQAERKLGYGPEPTGFVKVMPPYHYRANDKFSAEEHGEECAKQLEETIIYEGAETIAAFITEPMLSGGGVIVPPSNYLKRVREICDRYGILLIFDEVVSGFGRTGAMFGHTHWDVKADIFTFAKGLASGYQPIAATAVREGIFEAFYDEPGTMSHLRHINTFGGHPVSCAVAVINLEIVEREGLVANAATMGAQIKGNLASALADHPYVGDIRGKGLLIGVELVNDRTTKEPISETIMAKILAGCMQRGVFIGRNSNTVPGRCNVLLIAPPLVCGQVEADKILEAITDSLKACLD